MPFSAQLPNPPPPILRQGRRGWWQDMGEIRDGVREGGKGGCAAGGVRRVMGVEETCHAHPPTTHPLPCPPSITKHTKTQARQVQVIKWVGRCVKREKGWGCGGGMCVEVTAHCLPLHAPKAISYHWEMFPIVKIMP